MTRRATESRGEKCLNQFPGERVTDHPASEADHVQVVVLNALVRRKIITNQAGPNPRHFVGGDRCPNATSTDGHAAIHLPASDCAGQRHDKIRIIIIQLQLLVAEVNYLIASRAQLCNE